jgi:uncharacterized membrane protein YedE/YeeE
MPVFIALISGVLFGIGLAMGGMLDPAKVVGFLDIFGLWDPSLAFVMGGGVIVNLIGYFGFIRRMDQPVCERTFSSSAKTIIRYAIDRGIGFVWHWMGNYRPLPRPCCCFAFHKSGYWRYFSGLCWWRITSR